MKKFANFAMNSQNPNWNKAIKREEELYSSAYTTELIRDEFDRDFTRVLNSNAYKRLKHKTQVFYAPENDHICTRIEHVNLVDSISYNIAQYLGLNTELTRAIAIAHDLGHSPFGHQGEKVLSQISEEFTVKERTYAMTIIGLMVFLSISLIQNIHAPEEIIRHFSNISYTCAILYLGVFSSVIAFLLLNYANPYLPVAKTTVFANATTVVSVIAGVIFLHEKMTLLMFLSILMIITGVWGVQVLNVKSQISKTLTKYTDKI